MSKTHSQPQPISVLNAYAEMVDGMLEVSMEQLRNMCQVVLNPDEMDEVTLEQVLELYTQQLIDHWLFEEQFTRWLHNGLTDGQKKELNCVMAQTAALKTITVEILKLARSIEDDRINKLMDSDEVYLFDTTTPNILLLPH